MILLSCSGTGGHIYPAIATYQYIGKGAVFLIESQSIAESILPKYGCKYHSISVKRGSKRSLITGFFDALRFIRQNKVTQLISFGGYATVPVILAAFVCRVPITLHEQNTVPGKANRLLQRFATKICLSFEESKRYFSKKKCVMTGNPLRQQYPDDSLAKSITSNSDTNCRKLLIMGGSQGAEAINTFILTHKDQLASSKLSVIHVVGKNNYAAHFKTEAPALSQDNSKQIIWQHVDYIENMQLLYEWADKIIARAGATTIAELYRYQKEALFIPYPYASDNHQEENAKAYLAQTGLGDILLQRDLSVEKLKAFIESPLKQSKSAPKQANIQAIISA